MLKKRDEFVAQNPEKVKKIRKIREQLEIIRALRTETSEEKKLREFFQYGAKYEARETL